MNLRISILLAAASVAVALAAACGGGSGQSQPTATPSRAAGPSVPATTSAAAPGFGYVFSAGKITVIDLSRAQAVKQLTSGIDRVTDWGDTASSPDGKYVFANATSTAQVVVIDATRQEILQRIDVGSKPVHLYVLNGGTELWTHSDGEGTFYVIDLKSFQVTARVTAATLHTGHGELLSARALGTKYYATSATEPAVFAIDGATKAVLRRIDLCQGDDGKGSTHGQGFTAGNGYAYFECTGKVHQTAVVDTKTDAVVGYLDTGGEMYTAPGELRAFVANSARASVDILDGSKPGMPAITSVPVPHKATKILFDGASGKQLGFTADLTTPDVEVLDVTAGLVVRTIAGNPLATPVPEGGTLGRGSAVGNGYLLATVKEQGLAYVIDAKTLAAVGAVSIGGAVTAAIPAP